MPVAVVTGANKGVGFQIARLLAREGCDVVLGSRDAGRGEAACQAIFSELPNAKVVSMPLDLNDPKRLAGAAEDVKRMFGHVDILLNNAGFAFKIAAKEPFGQQARETIDINYFGTLAVYRSFLPLLRPGAHVVDVSSHAAVFRRLSKPLQDKILSNDLTVDQLSALMDQFVSEASSGSHNQKGWINTAYGVSKIGMTTLSRLMARDHPELIINACSPGWVRTDMAGPNAQLSPEQGADTPVWLTHVTSSWAFYMDRKPIELLSL